MTRSRVHWRTNTPVPPELQRVVRLTSRAEEERTRPALRYTLVSEWCLMLPVSYCLVVMGLVPDGLLAAWVLAPALTLVLMQRRFRSGRWKLGSPGSQTRPGL